MAQTSDTSTPFKAGAIGATTGGVVVLGYFFHQNAKVLLILVAGVVLVILLLLAYLWFLSRRRAAQSAKMGASLEESSRPKPRGINSPEALAKLADLQTKFEAGVAKFRAAGKDLYALPWYLLVGEPGGGKSEAIRHCNVGFPPGLQEEQQGVGGTINMNWWFTNHAIILDTAGRLMFDQVEAGATGEWKEFLKLLLKARPKCPINGMLLVIPAESLIVDTPEKINEKASKIARQLSTIQQTLGVRFPVFVVISKSDKINGFREFFDAQSDPRLQHQMMGWSNPQPLDSPFEPERVVDHLASISKRLVRRRLGLLLDPIHTEDPNGRRIDQVDALYAFPESLATIGPGLRQYLELIFTVGEWSPKPLFLRGIYFTSSMREGSALDKDLADLLGVPVESLPEGRVWEKDRAFFLRDLFMTKVFREKGLVTHANNARSLQRKRKIAILASGFAAVLILGVLTVFQFQQLQRNVGGKLKYWQNLQANYGGGDVKYDHMCLLTNPVGSSTGIFSTTRPTEFAYHGQDYFQLASQSGEKGEKLGVFFNDARHQVEAPIQVPAAFFWVKLLPSELKQEQRKAYFLLFENTVIRPVVAAVRLKLLAGVRLDPSDGTAADRTFDAVRELLQLEALKTGSAKSTATLDLGKLYRYVLSPEDWAQFDQEETADSSGVLDTDHHRLQKICDEIYAQVPSGAESSWPFSEGNIEVATKQSAVAIDTGVDELIAYWDKQIGDDNTSRVTVKLRDSLKDFQRAEGEIHQDIGAYQTFATMDQFPDLLKQLNLQLDALKQDKLKIDGFLAQINAGPSKLTPQTSLVTLYRDDRANAAVNERKQIKELIDTYRSDPGQDIIGGILRRLGSHKAMSPTMEIPQELSDALDQLDREYFTPAGGSTERPYQQIARAYDASSDAMSRNPTAGGSSDRSIKLFHVSDILAKPVQAGDALMKAVVNPLPDSPSPAKENCTFMIQKMAVGRDLYVAEGSLLADPSLSSRESVAKLVSNDSAARPIFQLLPLMPMTVPPVPTSDAGSYSPESALRVLSNWAELGRPLGVVPSTEPTTFTLGIADLRAKYAKDDDAVRAYTAAYMTYWRNAFDSHFSSMTTPKWGLDLSTALPNPATAIKLADEMFKASQDKILEPLKQVASVNTDAQKFIDDFDAQRVLPASTRPADSDQLVKWRQLLADKPDPADARKELRKLSGFPEFRNVYLAASINTRMDVYWSSVENSCLRSLANGVTEIALTGQKELTDKYSAFPLAAPAPGAQRESLKNPELKSAMTILSLWTDDIGWPPAPDILPGSPDDQCQKIMHPARPGGPVSQMIETAKFFYLAKDANKQEIEKADCNIYTVDVATQMKNKAGADQLAQGICDKVSIRFNNQDLEEPRAAFPPTRAEILGGVTMTGDAPHDSLDILPTMNLAPLPPTSFQAPWSCFRAVLGVGSYHPPGSNDWFVPVDVNGAKLFLKFSFVPHRK